MDVLEVVQKLSSNGYVVIKCLESCLSTEQVAAKIGSILDVSTILPGVSKVQTLIPRKPNLRLMNQYSGTYGTEEFPFHTDLAHWHLPPRYLMLRCIVGTKDVVTTIVPYSVIASVVGENALKQALVAPRRKSKEQIICPLPVVFYREESLGIRWDFLFLSPLNGSAKLIYETIASHTWHNEMIISVNLLDPGDTLIIDNWRMLHARSAVPENSMSRVIERIYLNRLGA